MRDISEKDLLWLALSNVKGLGIKKLMQIFSQFPNLSASDFKEQFFLRELENIVKSNEVINLISNEATIERLIKSAKEHIKIHKVKDIIVIPFTNDSYPELLKKIPDPPISLYCKGNLNLLKNNKNLAIIGTRQPTDTGLKIAEKLAYKFAKYQFTIVSGLALGIDTAGHLGALRANGSTIAVMAGSLDKIYPKENTKLAEQIIRNNGLLVSEIALGEKTQRSSFVKRDRIQSGLSLGVCPIQTSTTGGSMHTIKYASIQKRILFTPQILENENLEVYSGILQMLKQYTSYILKNSSDYEKLISIMIDNLKTISSYTPEKKYISKTRNETLDYQLEFDSIENLNFENPKSVDKIIYEVKQIVKPYNIEKNDLLELISKHW